MNPAEVINDIERTIDRAMLCDAPGDNIAEYLWGDSGGWFTGDNQDGTITINVSNDADFYARAFNLFLSARLVDNSAPLDDATERTFRPNSWTSTPNAILLTAVGARTQDANCMWSLSDTYNGAYQGEVPLVVAAAYSSRYGQGTVENEGITSAWKGHRPFFVPYKLKRGSAVTVLIQPTFGRIVNAQVKTQFRASVLLSGYKIVRRPT